MSLAETEGGRRGGVLGGLLAPLRLPERVVEAPESLTAAARELRAMRSELLRVREQTEPLGGLLPTAERIREHADAIPDLLAVAERIREQAEPVAGLLTGLERLDSLHEVVVAVEDVESHLDKTVDGLGRELTAMHETIRGLQSDVERIADRLPDTDGPGPLAKAARWRAVAAIDAGGGHRRPLDHRLGRIGVRCPQARAPRYTWRRLASRRTARGGCRGELMTCTRQRSRAVRRPTADARHEP